MYKHMFSVFNTEKSIKFIGGFQSSQSQCASFLSRDVLKTLSVEELKALSILHYEEKDIWRNQILNQIDTLMQQESDQSFDRYSTDKIKEFVLLNAIFSKEDFFKDILIKINSIKREIEDSRINQKNLFYNDDGNSKNEEHCRDVIHQKLNDKYGYDIELIREKYEKDDKRVDINIRYKANSDYEVQVECKKDKNRDLYNGIKNQLIDSYFSSGVQFGIYLIFYFGDKKDKEKMLEKVEQSIPSGYHDKIEVVCIDLTK